METFSALLAFCVENSLVTGEFPAQRPVTRSFDVFFDLRLNKRLSKHPWGWWFETPSRSLWRHCNVYRFSHLGLVALYGIIKFGCHDFEAQTKEKIPIKILKSCASSTCVIDLIMLVSLFWPQRVNTLRPRQNGRHFADDSSNRIFVNENVRISIEFSLKFVPKGPINNIPALVQIMAWRRPGDKPLSEPVMVSLLMHICVTRPQRVKL